MPPIYKHQSERAVLEGKASRSARSYEFNGQVYSIGFYVLFDDALEHNVWCEKADIP